MTTRLDAANHQAEDPSAADSFDDLAPTDTSWVNEHTDFDLEPLSADEAELHRMPSVTEVGNWSAVQVRRVNWILLLWSAVTLPSMGIIYTVINAQGIRAQMPVFGLRLYKIPLPGFSVLRDYEGTYRLDLAHVFAVFLVLAVWYLWIVVIRVLLYGHDEVADPRLNAGRYYSFLYTVATIIILGDAFIFYAGLSDRVDSLWTESNSSVPIIATVLYMAVLAFMSMVHVHMSAKHFVETIDDASAR